MDIKCKRIECFAGSNYNVSTVKTIISRLTEIVDVFKQRGYPRELISVIPCSTALATYDSQL